MRWIVDIGYPLDEWDDAINDEELRAIAERFGSTDESAGTGFGMRDMQFLTNRKNVAISLRDQLALAIRVDENKASQPRDMYDTSPYATYYREPTNYLLYLLHYRDYKEFWQVLFRQALNPLYQHKRQKLNKEWLAKCSK